MQEPPFSPERSDHLHIESFLKVGFPGRIIGMSLSTDLRVPLDANRVGREETYHFDLSFLTLEDSCEHPPIHPSGWPVFLLDPPARFVAMLTLSPGPQRFEDFMIGSVKHVLAHHMTVVQGPSAYLRIQFCDQVSCCQVSALLDVFSDLGEKCLDALL